MPRAICTIIAKNYLAFARTLAQSYLSLHPADKVYVLVVDEFAGYITPEDESFEIVKLSDLSIPHVRSLCFKYNLKELCTAVKARLLEYLLNEHSVEKVLYLDPDILVTAKLDSLYDKLDTHDIVLTPHVDEDYPDDGLLPDDSHILRAGQFNLGFIGVNSSDNARRFLEWWKTKLDEHCLVDLKNGYFVDQKFIDFVPILFENFWIERETGYNVAYWNLHSRRLSLINGSWRCNNGPLRFFHFSGYTPDGPGLSSHIPVSMARHLPSNRKDLSELFAQYRALLTTNQYEPTIHWPYTYSTFNSGKVIPDRVRRYYRELGNNRASLPDPFASEELGLVSDEQADGDELTASRQLDTILNSRAWRWIARYGRLKDRFVRVFRSDA
jgi:lipopolysaccharide biosynthesis glycosyltransferase